MFEVSSSIYLFKKKKKKKALTLTKAAFILSVIFSSHYLEIILA